MRSIKRLLCLALALALLLTAALSAALADGEDAAEPTQAEAAEKAEKAEKEASGSGEAKSEEAPKQEESEKKEEPAKEESDTKEEAKQEELEKQEEPAKEEAGSDGQDSGDPISSESGSDGGESGESGAEDSGTDESDSGESDGDTVPEDSEPGDTGSGETDTGAEDAGEAEASPTPETTPTPEEQPPQTEEPAQTEEPQTPAEDPREQAEDADEKVDVALTIAEPQGLELVGGAYQIDPAKVSAITLSWKTDGPIDRYAVTVSGGVYSDKTKDTALTLSVAALDAGRYTVTVEALKDDKSVGQAQIYFDILQTAEEAPEGETPEGEAPEGEGETPEGETPEGEGPEGGMPEGGFPGGGFPGGGRRGGGARGGASGGTGAAAEVEQGFRVTAGEALTSSHTSGSKDMSLYGSVSLSLEDDTAMTALVLGDAALDIGLNDGGSFTAEVDGDVLKLLPEGGAEAWSLNGYALKTLARSGIDTLRLSLNGNTVDFPTQPALGGEIYGALCAAGYVSRDFTFTVYGDAVEVSVAGETWRLSESGELSRREDD